MTFRSYLGTVAVKRAASPLWKRRLLHWTFYEVVRFMCQKDGAGNFLTLIKIFHSLYLLEHSEDDKIFVSCYLSLCVSSVCLSSNYFLLRF